MAGGIALGMSECQTVQRAGTPSNVAISGGDLSASGLRAEDRALQNAWSVVMRQWGDTLKARKTADSLAALRAQGRQ